VEYNDKLNRDETFDYMQRKKEEEKHLSRKESREMEIRMLSKRGRSKRIMEWIEL